MSISALDVVLAGAALWLLKLVLSKKPAGRLPPGPPGLPLLANIFDLPQKEQWKTFTEWGRKYGPITHVSALGQSVVVLNDVNAASEMLDKKSTIYSDRPVLVMGGELTGWKDTLALTRYGDRFKEYRKHMHSVMGSRTNIEKTHGLFETEALEFLKRVLRKPQDLAENIRKTAGAIILQITYGYKPKEENDDFVDLVDVAIHQFSEITEPNAYLVDLFPPLQYVPSWFPGATFKKTAQSYYQTLQDMAEQPMNFVRKQIAAGEAPPSLVANLLDRQNTSEQERNIKWAAASMYSGGADTLSSALVLSERPTQTVSALYSFYLALTIYPEAQRKAQAEIDAVVGSDRLPTFADRASLPYVEALVNEVLRWGTVAPLGLPHTVTQDDIHDGYFIEKGTIVLANIKGMLHNPDVYPDPWEFKPERFIASEGKPAEQDPRACCFGFGRRICPGLLLADATVWASIVMSIAVFDVERKVVNGVEIVPEPKYSDGIISHPEHFECVVKPRSAKTEALILAH
ncbi:cytochrome P450 [Auriscalpium vulgare]|uniref:Cytochrome P450 n=1 Tax=Auriscalpium vulgare TaxID=40419 RepID=A0ACB8S1I1_9AGAM|nr:cytochrome P450 [Auriscalpium vulgare]